MTILLELLWESMATQRATAMPSADAGDLTVAGVAAFPRLRALAWRDDVLYAARGYNLLRAAMTARPIEWQQAARYHPAWWRNLSASSRLTFRDRKSTRLNSSHGYISYAVFCLKKKKKKRIRH